MQLTRGHSGFSIVGDFVRFSSYFCLDTARFTISNQRGSFFSDWSFPFFCYICIQQMCDHQRALSRPYAVFEGLKKWRLVQLFLHMAERILGAVEYAIAPVKGKIGPVTCTVTLINTVCLSWLVKQSPKPVTGGSSTVDVASLPEELGGLPKLLNIRLLTGSSSTGSNSNVMTSSTCPLNILG